jgi:hypothetical protein
MYRWRWGVGRSKGGTPWLAVSLLVHAAKSGAHICTDSRICLLPKVQPISAISASDVILLATIARNALRVSLRSAKQHYWMRQQSTCVWVGSGG